VSAGATIEKKSTVSCYSADTLLLQCSTAFFANSGGPWPTPATFWLRPWFKEATSSPNSLRSWGRWWPSLEWCVEASKKTSMECGRGTGAVRKRVTELSVR
jgi:hypothetical protein